MASFSVTVPSSNIELTSYVPKINEVGEGTLVDFEQLVAIKGIGTLIVLEQEIIYKGSGLLIDFEQSIKSPGVSGILIELQQTVKSGLGKFKGLLLS